MQEPWHPVFTEGYLRNTGDYTPYIDQKSCWESVEDHFTCLDRHNEVYGMIYILLLLSINSLMI